MPIFAAQLFESTPPEMTAQKARTLLQDAFARLPLSLILLGWDVPPQIEAAVANEAVLHRAQVFQWHPLLTGERDTPTEWRTRNLRDEPIPGFHDMPEFTFVCPNRPAVQDFVLTRAEKVIRRGLYRGLFLDRIRYPSPAAAPEKFLGCFCADCRRAAKEAGLDLEAVRRQLEALLARGGGRIALTRGLFRAFETPDALLEAFFRFRADSVTRVVSALSQRLDAAGMETGLDCFSPSLARMVGQDLAALDKVSAWAKTMTYPHTFGPAGLPFELLGLLDWLAGQESGDGLGVLEKASGLGLPRAREELAGAGLPSAAIHGEIEQGRALGLTTLLAGVALVDMPGINQVDAVTARADLQACMGADGLVLSWDLQLIPLELLTTIYNLWSKPRETP